MAAVARLSSLHSHEVWRRTISRKQLEGLEQQFKAGEVDLVRVVTARTSFFTARRAALDTLNEVAQASATLVAATGLPPEAILTPQATEK